MGLRLANWELKITETEVSQSGAAVGSGKSEKKGALETESGVSPGGAATAHCSPGCKSRGDPQSFGGSRKFKPGKGYRCALEGAHTESLS